MTVAAGCGLKGSAPTAKPPGVLSDLTVEGVDGAVLVSFRGTAAARDERVIAFDVLRRAASGSARTFFEKIGSVPVTLDDVDGIHTFVDRPAAPGVTYLYRVRPRFPNERAPDRVRYSGPEATILWEDPLPPPATVTAVPLHLSARLSWSPVDGAAGYRVYGVDSAGRAAPMPANRGLLDRTSWVAYGLTDGRAERYVVRSVRVVAPAPSPVPASSPTAPPAQGAAPPVPAAPSAAEVVDAAGEGISIPRSDVGGALRRAAESLTGEGARPGIESVNSAVVAVVPGLTSTPPAPHQLKAAVVSNGVSLSWRPSTGEEIVGYHIERRELTADGKPKQLIFRRITGTPVTGTGYIDTTVVKGRRYEYQVRSVDASGNEGNPTEPRAITFRP